MGHIAHLKKTISFAHDMHVYNHNVDKEGKKDIVSFLKTIFKVESPFPKDTLCQVWLKLAQWFLRRRFLNFVNVFSLYRYYLPFERV